MQTPVRGQNQTMTGIQSCERGFGKPLAILSVSVAAIVVALLLFGGIIRRFVRESLMQRVTSAHYEILCPPGALTQAAMTEFATQREPLFAILNKKLNDVDSNMEIRIIFDPTFPGSAPGETGEQTYSVTGRTIRTKLIGRIPRLPAAADAQALLYMAWGKPGSGQLAQWAAIWLVGEWHGGDIGMAAAEVEQRLGHKKVVSVLADPGGEISSPDDQTLLGAAWVSEIAEFGGGASVRKLYATKMPHPNIDAVTKVLGTTPLELDRKWQLWMYAYLAGMPATPRDSGMPMNMRMGGNQ
jgi:hypothetical protein